MTEKDGEPSWNPVWSNSSRSSCKDQFQRFLSNIWNNLTPWFTYLWMWCAFPKIHYTSMSEVIYKRYMLDDCSYTSATELLLSYLEHFHFRTGPNFFPCSLLDIHCVIFVTFVPWTGVDFASWRSIAWVCNGGKTTCETWRNMRRTRKGETSIARCLESGSTPLTLEYCVK